MSENEQITIIKQRIKRDLLTTTITILKNDIDEVAFLLIRL